jgi:hypothetical protein
MTPQKALWILAGLFLLFQVFMRYDTWPVGQNKRAVFDNLTGRQMILERGQRQNPVQWLLGSAPRKRPGYDDDTALDEEDADEGIDTRAVAEANPRSNRNNAADRAFDPTAERPRRQALEQGNENHEKNAGSQRKAKQRKVTADEDAFVYADDEAEYVKETPKPKLRRRNPERETENKAQTTDGNRPRRQVTEKTDEVAPVKKVRSLRKPIPDSSPVPRAKPDDAEQDLLIAPTPPTPKLTDVSRHKPKVAVNDFNQDGHSEQIVQSQPNAQGQIDFAVISHGKELFYGKGYQMRVLTTRHKGWPDLALVTTGDKVSVYRYNSATGEYTPNP